MAKADSFNTSDGRDPATAGDGSDRPRRRHRFRQKPNRGESDLPAYRVIGVKGGTAEDADVIIHAATAANARIKAKILGIIVTSIKPFSGAESDAAPEYARTAATRARPSAPADADPQDFDDETTVFNGAKWSSWPKVLGMVSLIWGGSWILGGVVGFFVGFTEGHLLSWSSDLVDLLFCGFMVLYGSLSVQAGHRLTGHLRSSVSLQKFVWGVAFMLGLVCLFWPRLMSPGGLAGTVLLLVMSVPYPVFLFFWFSDNTVKAQVRAWA